MVSQPSDPQGTNEYNRGGVVASHEAYNENLSRRNGVGVVEKGTDDEQQCPTCGGRGFVPDDDDQHEEVIKTSIK